MKCKRCNRKLKDAKSIEQGCGKTCLEKMTIESKTQKSIDYYTKKGEKDNDKTET